MDEDDALVVLAFGYFLSQLTDLCHCIQAANLSSSA